MTLPSLILQGLKALLPVAVKEAVKGLRQMPRPRRVEESMPLSHRDAEIQAKASREAGPPPRKPRTRYDE